MAEKTAKELWEAAKLIKRGASFDEFPDGFTWDDMARAEALAARVNFDAELEEHTDVG